MNEHDYTGSGYATGPNIELRNARAAKIRKSREEVYAKSKILKENGFFLKEAF